MAQPPFQADVFQVEPAATGTRTISRDSTDGALKFIDPIFTSGLLLSQLAGVQSITGVTTVGLGGGAVYTSIQDAVDVAPLTATMALPFVVLIFPGTYTENVSISQDGVVLVGVGHVTVTNDEDDPTITITESAVGVPKFTKLSNLTIENTDVSGVCVYVDGSNTFAYGTATVVTAPLAAADTLVIGGAILTGVATTRTSGSNNFDTTKGTAALMAIEIAAALNDEDNAFASSVSAEAVAAVVTITALTAGAAGNANTLTSVTAPLGGITLSGATFAGGGGLDSEVALDEVLIDNCTLVASGVGGFQVSGLTANHVRVVGGTFDGSASTSEIILDQVASLKVRGVGVVFGLEVGYDSGEDAPSDATCVVSVTGVETVGDVLSNLVGVGSLTLSNCPTVGGVTLAGDRTFRASGCALGDVTVGGTVVATLSRSTRGAIGGAGTVAETSLTVSEALVAALTSTVAFDCTQTDALYTVLVDAPTAGVVATVTAKTTDDFTVTFSAAVTGTVYYTVLRGV